MKVLVIGGTGFLGLHLVDNLIAKGHEVVLFNRGKTNKDSFTQLQTIHGDRLVSHDALRGLTFDAAIDTNARNPRAAREAAKVLRKQVGHYSFISSISAFDALQGTPSDETVLTEESKLAPLAADLYEDQTASTYGGRKAECERVILEECHGDALIVRPGLIVGPGDTTDRFTYWPVRYGEGGDILAPGTGEDAVRFIDGRDLSSWMVALLEKRVLGTFNAVGPNHQLTMKDMLTACAEAAGTASKTHWVDQAFLTENAVRPWSDMPVWAPGLIPISADKAFASGLTCRPVKAIAKDTLGWAHERNIQRPLQAGLTSEREKELLSQWKSRAKN